MKYTKADYFNKNYVKRLQKSIGQTEQIMALDCSFLLKLKVYKLNI